MAARFRDAYDQPVSSRSQAAVAHYVEGVGRILARNAGAREALDAAIEADDGFALAHAALAIVLQGGGQPVHARASAARARSLSSGASRRELRHVVALATAVEGNSAAAYDLMREHLREYPRDALLLRQTHFLLNSSGKQDRKEEGLACVVEVAPQYGEDPWFLATFAFARSELYDCMEALRLAQRSYALEPRSCNVAHSISHALFESGDHEAGAAFLDSWLNDAEWQRGYDSHLAWHLALDELDRDNVERTTQLYERRLRPDRHPGAPVIVLADAASLLWRWHILGLPSPPAAGRVVADYAAAQFPRVGQAFIDIHRAMALALAGDHEALAALAGETQRLADADGLAAGPVISSAINALAAFARGTFAGAADALEPYAQDFVRAGGSHAQFEVLEDTLIAACMRSGRHQRAAQLLEERLERRPSRRDTTWLKQVREATFRPAIPNQHPAAEEWSA